MAKCSKCQQRAQALRAKRAKAVPSRHTVVNNAVSTGQALKRATPNVRGTR